MVIYCLMFFRYAILTKETWPSWTGDPKNGAEWIVSCLNLDSSHYQLGKTKIFIKAPETVIIINTIIIKH